MKNINFLAVSVDWKLTLTKSEKSFRTYALTNCASLVRPDPALSWAGAACRLGHDGMRDTCMHMTSGR